LIQIEIGVKNNMVGRTQSDSFDYNIWKYNKYADSYGMNSLINDIGYRVSAAHYFMTYSGAKDR
jgi:hypothetical protein